MRYTIPEEWLSFCDFEMVSPGYRFYCYEQNSNAQPVPLSEIEPPVRGEGVDPFKKYKMVPVLMAMMDPEGILPPIVVAPIEYTSTYKYRVVNGFHRFYASAQRGYPQIPVVLSDGGRW
ncbi:ParB N-terminal domain-containing protein [Rhodanobacter sp. DHG33]|nr:ParB N-terminal domain-containing protein [Rhodanobacter sp. DHG33]